MAKSKTIRRSKDSPQPAPRSSDPFEPAVPRIVWILMLLALAIRLPLAWSLGLWLDEIGVLDHVSRPFTENLRTLHFVHFAAIKPFAALGAAEFLIRVPSVLFGVLSVGLGFLVARRLFSSRVAVLFAYFLVVIPYFINYSVDANYYAHMIFWSLAVLYFYSRLKTTGRLWNLVPIVLIGPTGFFVHPFFGIYFASFLLFLIVHLAVTPAYFERSGWLGAVVKSWPRRLAVIAVAAAVLVLGLFVVGEESVFHQVVRMMNAFIALLSLGETPTHVEFTYDFFYDYFSRIGPAFYLFRAPHPIAQAAAGAGTYLVFGFFVLGCFRIARRDAQTALLFILCFFISFVLIFNLEASHAFYIRYFSYLTPIFWMAVSAGVVACGEALAERPSPLWAAANPQRPIAAVAAVLFLFSLPQYTYLAWGAVSGEGRNWDRVMPKVAERAREGDLFLHTRLTESPSVEYYLDKYGVGTQNSRRLDFITKRDKFAEAQLKDYCYRTPRVWYLWGWRYNYSTEAVRWAQARMETVASGISVLARYHDSTAFFWNWGGRYVMPPRIYRYQPPGDPPGQAETFSRELLFEETRRYEIRFYLVDPPGDAESFTVSVDEGSFRPLASRTDEGQDFLGYALEIDEGPHRIALASAGRPFEIQAMEVIPRYRDDVIAIPGWMTHDILPSNYVWTSQEEGQHALGMRRNAYADYRVDVSEGGDFWIACEAKNERVESRRPYSILLEFRLDDRAIALLSFDRKDDSWEEKSFPAFIPAGSHRLSVRFLSEAKDAKTAPEERHTAWIRQLKLVPGGADAARPSRSGAGSYFRPDPSYPRRVDLPAHPPENTFGEPAPDFTRPDAWRFVSPDPLTPEIVHNRRLDQPVLRARLNRSFEGFELVSPPIPVAESGLIYYSALIRAAGLDNHTANIRTVMLDKSHQLMLSDNNQIYQFIVNQEGIGGTSDWVRFVGVHRVDPDKVGYYVTVLWVYANSRIKRGSRGTVFFGGLQIEAQ